VQALVGVDAREATSPLMTEVADRPAASPEPAMLFFVPGAAPGAATARAYEEMRGYAEARTGRKVRHDRIFSLSCRRGGVDSEARVGDVDPFGGHLVHAIFATSEGYTIVWPGGHADVTKRQTYEAVAFG